MPDGIDALRCQLNSLRLRANDVRRRNPGAPPVETWVRGAFEKLDSILRDEPDEETEAASLRREISKLEAWLGQYE